MLKDFAEETSAHSYVAGYATCSIIGALLDLTGFFLDYKVLVQHELGLRLVIIKMTDYVTGLQG